MIKVGEKLFFELIDCFRTCELFTTVAIDSQVTVIWDSQLE